MRWKIAGKERILIVLLKKVGLHQKTKNGNSLHFPACSKNPFVLASKPEGDTRVNNGITGEEVHRIVFRNGIFDAKLSDDGNSHVVVTNLFDDDEALQSLNQSQLNYHPIFNLTLGVMKSAVLIDVSVAPADKTLYRVIFYRWFIPTVCASNDYDTSCRRSKSEYFRNAL